MADDKLRELTPIAIDFHPGERPTDEKLEGMMTQVDDAFDQVEDILGDLFGDSGVNTLWTTNIGRDLGDRSKLNPVILPDIIENNYAQQLTLGKNEHELDLIPIGSGSSILVATSDSSVSLAGYKTSEQLLTQVGDWTIRSGKAENGLDKNSRKLITFSPSSGGVITFAQVTSGKGSAYHGARLNVIPSVAQASAGGPFIDVVLSDIPDNIYTITLPLHELEYDSLNNSSSTTASNIQPSLLGGKQAELPSYFFDPSGLDLVSDDVSGGPKSIPLNSIQIWDWDEKKMIEGVEELKCSTNIAARKYQFTVKFRPDIVLDESAGRYMITTSGTSVYEMLGAIQRELYFHNHDGDDQVRHISHKSLMGLRTSSTNLGDVAAWYGPSNIDSNDHPMYFHRDGFTNSDTGAGGNVIRGDVVVGSTANGASGHPKYNREADSHAVAFGTQNDGGRAYFDKSRIHNLPEGRGNIPQNFNDTALVVEGAESDTTPGLKTSFHEGNLRVGGNTVLGTSPDEDTLVSGDLYVHQSATLTPKSDAELSAIPGETGKMTYSSTQNAPVYWNGSAWVNVAAAGYSAVVGDGLTSFGRFNGSTHLAAQAAVDYVQSTGGGKVLILRGAYNFGANSVVLTANTSVEGEGFSTHITGTATLFVFSSASVECGLKNLRLDSALIGADISGSRHILSDLHANGCVQGWVQRTGASSNQLHHIHTSGFLNESLEPNNFYTAKSSIGYINGSFAIDPVDKAASLPLFRRTSGTGTISYETSTDTAMGLGRYAITGTGVWLVDSFMPVNPALGIGGSVAHKASANGGSLIVGAECYDSSMVSLGNNGGFVANSAASTTSWQTKFSYARAELNSGANNLRIGTRFVKPLISVTSNPGTIYIDSLNVNPMNFAALALYY